MKSTRAKLAALAASAVIVAIVAAAVAFNLFIGWKVEADAVNDIEYLLSLNDEAVSTGRTPNYFLVDSSYRIDGAELPRPSDDEEALAAWFSEHPETGVVNRVTIDGWTCYAAIAQASEYTTYYESAPDERDTYYEGSSGERDAYYGDAYGGGHRSSADRWGWDEDDAHVSGYYIAYIDMASEESLIASVNTAFAIIGVLGALVAAIAGFVAGRRIDEAQEAQKRFYENMSHDLKTPLAAIRGYAEGASGGVVDLQDATRAIVRETDIMTETINEILGLSRLESGVVQPEKEAVVVGDFVQDCLMPLEGAVRAKGIDVQLDLAPGEVMADPGLFDHALSNVLTNAVRHAATCVRVSYDGARLSVWNDGGAPAADKLPHLFDRFQSGEGGSTGIGLAIAKEVATLHGWTVSARAVEDGLELSFTF